MDPMVYQPLQILSSAQSFFVKTFGTSTETNSLLVTVQHLERWITHARDELENSPDELETFTMSEPMRVEITSLVSRADRLSVLVWTPGTSDVDGCINLSQPKPLKHTLALTDNTVPILSLMDKLESDGYPPKLQMLRHYRTSRKAYDARQPLKSRSYFQCVLHAHSLFSQGALPFASGCSHNFYELLLKFPDRARDSLSASECKALMNESRGQTPATLSIMDEAPALDDDVACDSDVAGDSDVDDGPVCKKPKPVVVAAPVLAICDDKSNDSSSPSDISPPGSIAGDDTPDEDAFRIPASVDGQRAYVETHVGQPKSKGVRIHCNNPSHVGCNKFRRLHIDRAEFGHDCVVAYLGAWLQRSGELDLRGHQQLKPSRIQMWEYVRTKKRGRPVL